MSGNKQTPKCTINHVIQSDGKRNIAICRNDVVLFECRVDGYDSCFLGTDDGTLIEFTDEPIIRFLQGKVYNGSENNVLLKPPNFIVFGETLITPNLPSNHDYDINFILQADKNTVTLFQTDIWEPSTTKNIVQFNAEDYILFAGGDLFEFYVDSFALERFLPLHSTNVVKGFFTGLEQRNLKPTRLEFHTLATWILTGPVALLSPKLQLTLSDEVVNSRRVTGIDNKSVCLYTNISEH